jgi:hypothetical protein
VQKSGKQSNISLTKMGAALESTTNTHLSAGQNWKYESWVVTLNHEDTAGKVRGKR